MSKNGSTAAPFKVAAIVVLGLVLSGCFVAFDARGCPQERKYTRAEQAAISAALDKSPRVVQNVIVDYGKLRDQARACRGER